jgi:hypothetical protein
VDVVGHDDEGVGVDVVESVRKRVPFRLDDRSEIRIFE